MIQNVYYPAIGLPRFNLTYDEIQAALDDPDGLIWVNLEKPSSQEYEELLSARFHFHPLAIEDCQSEGFQVPKLDDYGDYLFIVSEAITKPGDFEQLNTRELNIFLGSNYVVSVCQSGEVAAVKRLWQRIARDERITSNGSDFLCHALLDYLIDEYTPHLDKVEDEIDLLEDQVVSEPKVTTLETILMLKHHLMALRRVITPQREVLNQLSRYEYVMIDNQSRLYFRDIYDHLVRLYESVDIIRDMTTSTLDVYLNATSLRLNAVMKALTIVSTIFLPLAFVAGIYGMNFKVMPEITWKYGYPFAWLIFIVIAVGMLLFFRKRKWF
jgi:magnesium transporter